MIKPLLAFLVVLASTTVLLAQAPSAPTNLVVTNGTGNNINLAWTDNASTETGFKIERKLGVSGSYSQIDTAAANATTYADNSVKTANRPYIYRVKATNGSGDSGPSNEDDATTPFTGTVNNYKTDTANYAETPTTMPLPLAGGTFYDETFGTKIMRFTDEADGTSFGTTYSVWSTPNCNNTKIFMFNSIDNNYHIGTLNPTTFTRVGALQTVANPPATMFHHLESAFWSTTDPDKMYVAVDAKFYTYKPSTNAYTLLKDLTSSFPAGYYFIQLYGSNDNNRLGVMIRNSSSDQGFIVYEISTDTIKLDVRTTDMNGIGMDKSGNYVYYVPDTPGGNTKVYNVNTGVGTDLVSDLFTGEVDYAPGHNDTGTNFLVGADSWRGAINVRPMSTPHAYTVAWTYAPYWINYHTSMRATNENWTLMSTYGDVVVSSDPAKYRRELFQAGVAGVYLGQLRRLVHARSNWSSSVFRTINGATNASPIVIQTTAAHNLQTGQLAQVSGVGGNTAANGTRYITVVDSTHFSINGTTGNGAYTSGGQVYVETYWDTPRANISRDGTLLFWTSNWNGVEGGSRRDLYVAQITAAAGSTSGKCEWNTSPRCQ